MKVAPVTAVHVDAVLEIANGCGLSPWPKREYLQAVRDPDVIFQCAVEGETRVPIGFIIGRVVGTEAEIHNIGVLREYRQQSVGSGLVTEFFIEAGNRGVSSIWLEVRKSNRTALLFYQKHGFKAVSERPNMYSDPVEDGVLMRADVTGLGPDQIA